MKSLVGIVAGLFLGLVLVLLIDAVLRTSGHVLTGGAATLLVLLSMLVGLFAARTQRGRP